MYIYIYMYIYTMYIMYKYTHNFILNSMLSNVRIIG